MCARVSATACAACPAAFLASIRAWTVDPNCCLRATARSRSRRASLIAGSSVFTESARQDTFQAANRRQRLVEPSNRMRRGHSSTLPSVAAFAEERGLPLAWLVPDLPASGLFAYGTNFDEYARVTANRPYLEGANSAISRSNSQRGSAWSSTQGSPVAWSDPPTVDAGCG